MAVHTVTKSCWNFHDRQIPNFSRLSVLFRKQFKIIFSFMKFKDFSRLALNSRPAQKPWLTHCNANAEIPNSRPSNATPWKVSSGSHLPSTPLPAVTALISEPHGWPVRRETYTVTFPAARHHRPFFFFLHSVLCWSVAVSTMRRQSQERI